MIDAELYRVFHRVADCGNISTAATQLFVSQPAVSKSIRKLEELTGCTLFVRRPRGVELTTEGQILFDYVREAFGHLENGEKMLKKLRDREEGLVRVGISTTLCRYVLLPHLEAFHQRFPGIRISIVNRTVADTLKLLAQGLIDFGIISIPVDQAGFTFHELLQIEDVFVAGRDQPRPAGPVSAAALKSWPLMMLEKDNVSRLYVDGRLAEQGVVLQPEIEVGSMDFLIEFARIGLGIALVIRNFVEAELRQGVLVEVPLLPPIPPRTVGIAVPAKLPLSRAAEAFIDFLQERRA